MDPVVAQLLAELERIDPGFARSLKWIVDNDPSPLCEVGRCTRTTPTGSVASSCGAAMRAVRPPLPESTEPSGFGPSRRPSCGGFFFLSLLGRRRLTYEMDMVGSQRLLICLWGGQSTRRAIRSQSRGQNDRLVTRPSRDDAVVTSRAAAAARRDVRDDAPRREAAREDAAELRPRDEPVRRHTMSRVSLRAPSCISSCPSRFGRRMRQRVVHIPPCVVTCRHVSSCPAALRPHATSQRVTERAVRRRRRRRHRLLRPRARCCRCSRRLSFSPNSRFETRLARMSIIVHFVALNDHK